MDVRGELAEMQKHIAALQNENLGFERRGVV
jgi:hypothetical protein